MKTKLSISLDEETVSKIEEQISKGVFRNKSHAVEFALNRLEE
ncbi:hypothetical protein ACFLZ7_03810 [Nanoarchaeota archaeon]